MKLEISISELYGAKKRYSDSIFAFSLRVKSKLEAAFPDIDLNIRIGQWGIWIYSPSGKDEVKKAEEIIGFCADELKLIALPV